MDTRYKNLFGLQSGGKRIYHVNDGEVTQDEYQYCAILNQILFGKRGLVDTLGPTWEMVHDPRFERIENLFVIDKPSRFGGDARVGVQTQLADGTFTGSFAGLEQYSEILGEGRFLHDVVLSDAILFLLEALFASDRKFRLSPEDPHRGLALVMPYSQAQLALLVREAKIEAQPDVVLTADEVAALAYATDPTVFERIGLLSPEEKRDVQEILDSGFDYPSPRWAHHWEDEVIWELIKREYRNYFTRTGQPNQVAETLFKLIKADLLGLIADYAEVANINETFLLEDCSTLFDPSIHSDETPRVFAEVAMLEQALTYRAEIRVTAARLASYVGIPTEWLIDLTDAERDELVRIMFSKRWPDERMGLVMEMTQYLMAVKLQGLNVEQRQALQLKVASAESQETCRALKTGQIRQITRETDGVGDDSRSGAERILDRILSDPLAQHVFARLTALDAEFSRLKDSFCVATDALSASEREDVVNDYISAKSGEMSVIPPSIGHAEFEQLEQLWKLNAAIKLLEPVFATVDFSIDEEQATKLLSGVEELVPTPQVEVAQYEGTLPGEPTIG